MVDHLTHKVRHLERKADLKSGDTILDIGSNECTSLKACTTSSLKRIGIDPTGENFRSYYPEDVKLISDFFLAKAYRSATAATASIVTSIAMFYDLEDPIGFAREVESILAPDGLWHFEQSYMPSMLRLSSYDELRRGIARLTASALVLQHALGVENFAAEQAIELGVVFDAARVGREHHGFFLHRGVDDDVGQIGDAQRLRLDRNAQVFLHECIQPVLAHPLPPVRNRRAIKRQLVSKELFAAEELEKRVLDPACAEPLIRQIVGVLQDGKAAINRAASGRWPGVSE